MKRDHRGRVTTTRSAGARSSTSSIRSSLIATHPVELCRYPNKRCWSARVLKDNGELHSFCEWHRTCANQYQRRLEARRRDKKLGGNIGSPDATPPAVIPPAPPASQPPQYKPNMCVEAIQSLAEATSRAIAAADGESETKPAPVAKARARMRTPRAITTAPGAGANEYEPFQSPVPLQIEDLQYLSLCFPEAAAGDDGC